MDDFTFFFRKYQTDKPKYGDFYTRYFSNLNPAILLEIGVLKGGSIRAWRDIFQDTRVTGIDIDPKCKEGNEDLEILIGDQTDTKFLNWVLANVGIPDIIIDDGGHSRSHQILSFRYLFPRMKSGGIYVIEDLETCMLEDYDDYPESTIKVISDLIIPSNFDGTKGKKVGFKFDYAYSSITFEYNICMVVKR